MVRRAAVRLGLYLLALGIAAGLVYIPYAEAVYAHRIHPKLALICIVGAGTILWSILPRIDRFAPPGPRLEAARHPELFRDPSQVGGLEPVAWESVVATAFLPAWRDAVSKNASVLDGATVTARRDGVVIAPFDVVQALADGTMNGEVWREEAERVGVARLPLVG